MTGHADNYLPGLRFTCSRLNGSDFPTGTLPLFPHTRYNIFLHKMPPQRTPLGSILGNRLLNGEMSPYQRGIAIGMSVMGGKLQQIEVALDISRAALRCTLTMAQLREEGFAQRRSGRPLKYTPAEERKPVRHVRLYPKDTYAQLIVACELGIKNTTIIKILKQYGIVNWRSRRRQSLTEKNAADRLA
jgi:hypothetical protein